MRPEHIQITGYFSAFIESYFDDLGHRWLSEIPSIVARYAEKWDLAVQPPFDGLTFNYVAPVSRADGSQAVLKVGVPEQEQIGEILALRAFSGRGTARLYESNVDHHVSLIERLSPGVLLATLFPERDEEATEIAGGIMRKLAIPVPVETEGLATVEGWATRGMRNLRNEFDGGTGPFPTYLVERAESLFSDLLSSTDEQWLIHGDLHHMNILSNDTRGGWLAIDPKGVIGDRAFEAAAFILNPNTTLHTTPNLGSILARRIDILSEILEIDRQRIHGWALAFSVLSAWWDADSDHWQRTIEVSEQLAALQFG